MRVLQRSVMVAAICCRLEAIVCCSRGGQGSAEVEVQVRCYREVFARKGIGGRVSQAVFSCAGD